ncbi:MAG: GNAT family N-acetyltransferase [Rhizobacter sp.]|nr:GNAT family N-acetyltransferase [Rhizobacter sp.]
MTSGISIHCLETLVAPDQLQQLGEVLVDCVDGGASVSFMAGLSMARALAFWQQVAQQVQQGERALLVAQDASGHIVGTVQLALSQPDNQPHRADVNKLLVHRCARQRGVGEALMRAAEDLARARGKTLLVLDTASDAAERLYLRTGWLMCGHIPCFALMPDGSPTGTTILYKPLTISAPGP